MAQRQRGPLCAALERPGTRELHSSQQRQADRLRHSLMAMTSSSPHVHEDAAAAVCAPPTQLG